MVGSAACDSGARQQPLYWRRQMNHLKLGSGLVFASLFIAASSANATCYHKIGALCKSGYASGFNSDCSTPCTTGLNEPSKRQHASKPVARHPRLADSASRAE